MIAQAETILKNSALSVTSGRKRILEVFLSHDTALSHQDIESQCGDQHDRVTIYRTLQTFLDRGIIHNIPSSDNAVRYALCSDACMTSGHHHDNHVHFRCDKCGKTQCLDEVSIPKVKLPAGYAVTGIDMVVSGVCKSCA